MLTAAKAPSLNAELGSRCNRAAKLEGYYFVSVFAFGLAFLTIR